MTWYSSKDVAQVFFDNNNVASFLNQLSLKISAVLTDTTGLGDTWREYTDTGLRKGELSGSGFYDGTAAGQSLTTVTATQPVVSIPLEGNTVSKRFYGFQKADVTAVEIGISSDSVHTVNTEYTVKGEVNHGYVVAPLVSRGAAANTDLTYADIGADAASGHAFMHMTSLTLGGYTNVIVTVRDSDDHITFGTHTAFTARTATGSQVIALADTIEQYLSISWEWTGAGTGNSFWAFVGVAVD